MIYNSGGYKNKKGEFTVRERLFLLGILYAGHQHRVEGQIMFNNIPVPITDIPNNLGLIIKSERIKELEKLFFKQAGI